MIPSIRTAVNLSSQSLERIRVDFYLVSESVSVDTGLRWKYILVGLTMRFYTLIPLTVLNVPGYSGELRLQVGRLGPKSPPYAYEP